jgi:ribose transport system substrate-binding protein
MLARSYIKPSPPIFPACGALLLALAAALMPGCSKPEGPASSAGTSTDGGAAPPRALRIAMIAKSSATPSFLAARTGAENRARELSAKLGVKIVVDWLTPPREDAEVQASRIRQAVNDRADAILISCSDDARVTDAINVAVDRGVQVMTFDSDAPQSRRFTYYGVDDLQAGVTVMAELARLLPRKAKVAVLAGNPQAPNLRKRVEGIKREAARHPGLKLMGPYFHEETAEAAGAEVIRVSRAHRDIEGWAMVGGWPLYTKVLLGDLDPKKYKIVSINALPQELVYVEKGLAPVLLAQRTYLWGSVGVDTIVDKVILKKEVPARIEMELVRVTTDNLGSWARQLKAWGFPDVPEQYLKLPR